ncbi:MAG TPA: flippase-like domain-containing protein, partial [bacterium (Candidatus Stahlbacteria)]|nr:flippase-like domain-containing protein [Candidatus Stahlbacteria bacterium]
FLIIFFLTFERRTIEALIHMKIYFLVFLTATTLSALFFDSLTIHLLSLTSNPKISIGQALRVIISGYFAGAVTPFQAGTFPYQVWIFRGIGIRPGRAGAILFYRSAIPNLTALGLAPIIALRLGVTSHWAFSPLVIYFGILLFIFLVLVYSAVFRPKTLRRVLLRLGKRFPKLKKSVRFLLKEAQEFRSGMRIYFNRKNIGYFFLAFLTGNIFLFFLLLVSPLTLASFGISKVYLRAMGIQLLLRTILLYVPTPGATGVAEAGGLIFFAAICPKYLLGIFILIYRMFTFYLYVILGGIFIFKEGIFSQKALSPS